MHDQDPISETFIGIRMDKDLKADLIKCAKAQHRNLSNWARIALEEAAEKQLSKRR
ncbi:hypothetical protein [Nitrospira sp. BLG_2]|uniref:hypothetical protein n=1 Tax=Nitrospira sp. BLG_2 TaxID=3397507 RepID=UPI003B9DC04C